MGGKKLNIQEVKSFFEDCGYILLEDMFINSKKEMTFIDSENYLYYKSYNHFNNLMKENIKPERIYFSNIYTLSNIENFLKIDNRNFYLLPNQKFINSKSHLFFHCNICNDDFHNSWSQIFKGIDCSLCSGFQVGKYNNLAVKFPALIREWDYEKNYPNTPYSFVYTNVKKVYWVCPKGHSYKTRIIERTRRNCNCPFCCLNPKATKERNFAILYPELLLEWDYEKNEERNIFPNNITPFSNKKADWICKKCGHKWIINVYNRVKLGYGCPNCSGSYGEELVERKLNKLSLEFVREKWFSDCKISKKPLEFDFFIPSISTIIEVQGKHHYEPIDFANKGYEWAKNLFEINQKKDNYKRKYCEEKGMKLIEIPYWKLFNIENFLEDALNLRGKEV